MAGFLAGLLPMVLPKILSVGKNLLGSLTKNVSSLGAQAAKSVLGDTLGQTVVDYARPLVQKGVQYLGNRAKQQIRQGIQKVKGGGGGWIGKQVRQYVPQQYQQQAEDYFEDDYDTPQGQVSIEGEMYPAEDFTQTPYPTSFEQQQSQPAFERQSIKRRGIRKQQRAKQPPRQSYRQQQQQYYSQPEQMEEEVNYDTRGLYQDYQ